MKYTLTVTTYEPLTEEEMEENKRSGMRGMNGMGTAYPDQPFNTRQVRALHVQLTDEEFKAVKRAAVEAIK